MALKSEDRWLYVEHASMCVEHEPPDVEPGRLKAEQQLFSVEPPATPSKKRPAIQLDIPSPIRYNKIRTNVLFLFGGEQNLKILLSPLSYRWHCAIIYPCE